MSNHFTGLSLGPPLGDQRLDLCDLYAFKSPADPSRTVLILNANPQADFLHPDAIYRLAIDNDGDLRNDIAFSFVFSEPVDGRQTVDVYLAGTTRPRSPKPSGRRSSRLSRCRSARRRTSSPPASSRSSQAPAATRSSSTSTASRALFDTSGTRNFTSPNQPAPESPWTGVDSNTAGQCLLDGARAADERARRSTRHPDLGPLQPAPRRRTAPRRPGGAPVGEQLLQHRRHQGGVQRVANRSTIASVGSACSST